AAEHGRGRRVSGRVYVFTYASGRWGLRNPAFRENQLTAGFGEYVVFVRLLSPHSNLSAPGRCAARRPHPELAAGHPGHVCICGGRAAGGCPHNGRRLLATRRNPQLIYFPGRHGAGSGAVFTLGLAGVAPVHGQQEFFVVLGAFHAVLEEFHRLGGAHVGHELAEYPHAAQLVAAHQQVFAAGAGGRDVNGREHPLVGQLAVKLQFHVAGAFKFFEDN
nr:hypothetical protein [Tanacetum cinerariifolium]